MAILVSAAGSTQSHYNRSDWDVFWQVISEHLQEIKSHHKSAHIYVEIDRLIETNFRLWKRGAIGEKMNQKFEEIVNNADDIDRFHKVISLNQILVKYELSTSFTYVCHIGSLIHLGAYDTAHYLWRHFYEIHFSVDPLDVSTESARLMELCANFSQFILTELAFYNAMVSKGNLLEASRFIKARAYLQKEGHLQIDFKSEKKLKNKNPTALNEDIRFYVKSLEDLKYIKAAQPIEE